jgi:hypothetical protein
VTAENRIDVLPQSSHDTVCVTLRGVIGPEDYKKSLFDTLKNLTENGQTFNLLMNYDISFKGWDREAAEMSFRSIIDYGRKARKLAYVNAPDSKMLQIKMTQPLLGGEVRFFETEELDTAIAWVKS